MRIFDRNIETVKLRMQDGTLHETTIKELSNEGMAQWLELADEFRQVIVKIKEEYSQFLDAMNDPTIGAAEKESMIAAYKDKLDNDPDIKRNALRHQKLWQIITGEGEEDVSWVEKLYPSIPEKVISFFFSINPGLELLKKKGETEAILSVLAETMDDAGVLSRSLNSSEAVTE